ncbi:MAG: hypothetical protein JW822_06520 [Spirochaetales bacterium]|nr:hypothetical protein [Spirochaetales bacterium]
MKKEPDLFMKITVAVFLALGAAIFVLLIYYGVMNVNITQTPEYVEYNIEDLKKVPEELIKYAEYKDIPVPGELLYGITLLSQDRIAVSADSTVLIFELQGREVMNFTLSQPALCLASDEQDLIYTGMADHVEVYTFEGKQADIWAGLGNKAFITSITVNSGHVFVADAGNKLIMHYNTEGRLINFIGRRGEDDDFPGFIIPSPYFDVALTTETGLWAVNPGKRKLILFSYDGTPLKSWGSASTAIHGFSGCCNPTHIALTARGTIITSEKGLVRVKEYSATGELSAVVAAPAAFSDDTVGLDLAVSTKGDIFILDPHKKAVRIFKKTRGDND